MACRDDRSAAANGRMQRQPPESPLPAYANWRSRPEAVVAAYGKQTLMNVDITGAARPLSLGVRVDCRVSNLQNHDEFSFPTYRVVDVPTSKYEMNPGTKETPSVS